MKLSQEEFLRLKEQHERDVVAAERGKGALQQLLLQLRNQFDCDLKGAKRLLQKLNEEQATAEKELKNAINEYVRLRDGS